MIINSSLAKTWEIILILLLKKYFQKHRPEYFLDVFFLFKMLQTEIGKPLM